MTDIIVIGAGTAGMTAALYALRGGKSVLVLESDNFGGQISFSPRVENFPSIKQISGSDFADNLFEQIVALGAQVELEKVSAVEKVGKTFKVTTEYNTYEGKSVILAVGVKHRHFNLPKEKELIGHGVYYCALCDGPFYAGQDVVLVGDGNSALQYTLMLANYCKSVTVVTMFDRFFGDGAHIAALKQRENIKVIHNAVLTEFVGESELDGLKFKNSDGSTFDIATKALFVAIGQIPDNKIFSNLVELDKAGFIIADETCQTSCEGVFVAGDCRTKDVRQLTTAVADGAIASVNAAKYVDMLNLN